MERVEGLRRINSPEEYSEAKARLENYLKQYKWILESKMPYEDIKKALFKCVETRKTYENKADSDKTDETHESRESDRKVELENENKILSLKLQYEAIKSETYVGNLRRNITALYVTIGDYEARIETNSKKKNASKDEGKPSEESLPKDMLTSRSMRRFRFFFANLTGLVPGEINMDVENRKEIPLYILENYDLVNKPEITPEHKELALVVVPEVDTSKGIIHRLVGLPVEQFIASRGIREKGIYANTVRISEEEISVENKFIPREQPIDKQPVALENVKTQERAHNMETNHDKEDKDEIS